MGARGEPVPAETLSRALPAGLRGSCQASARVRGDGARAQPQTHVPGRILCCPVFPVPWLSSWGLPDLVALIIIISFFFF